MKEPVLAKPPLRPKPALAAREVGVSEPGFQGLLIWPSMLVARNLSSIVCGEPADWTSVQGPSRRVLKGGALGHTIH